MRHSAVGAASILVLVSIAARVQAAPPTTREEYQAAFAKLTIGMPEAEAREILGPPADIRTRYDHGGIRATQTKEIWGYGTNGHLSFPTLGQLYIDRDDRVQYVYGGQGKPPSQSQFSEDELRTILRTIHEAPGYQEGRTGFDPLRLIQVTNALQKLGKERALAAIDEYIRVSSSWDDDGRAGIFLVLRVLFDVPEDPGYMPRMMVGAPSPREPNDPKVFPRFPILLVDDIPFKLVSGYRLAGCPEPVENHVKHFRERGRFRSKPLRPTDDPLHALEAAERVGRAERIEDERPPGLDHYLHGQLLTLLRSVYESDLNELFWSMEQDRWASIASDIRKLSVKWDAAKVCYTFTDGRFYPERTPPNYRRDIWEPIRGLPFTVTLERQDETRVDVGYEVGILASGSKLATLKICETTNLGHPLREIELELPDVPLAELVQNGAPTGLKPMGTRYSGASVKAKPGSTLKLILTRAGEDPVGSPEFTP